MNRRNQLLLFASCVVVRSDLLRLGSLLRALVGVMTARPIPEHPEIFCHLHDAKEGSITVKGTK
jgi:hypothetical protein